MAEVSLTNKGCVCYFTILHNKDVHRSHLLHMKWFAE